MRKGGGIWARTDDECGFFRRGVKKTKFGILVMVVLLKRRRCPQKQPPPAAISRVLEVIRFYQNKVANMHLIRYQEFGVSRCVVDLIQIHDAWGCVSFRGSASQQSSLAGQRVEIDITGTCK